MTTEAQGERPLTTVEILRKAKAELERRGWYQGGLGEDVARGADCPVCLEGAINAAVCGDPFNYSSGSGKEALDVIREALGVDGFYCIGDQWNDDPERTWGEVAALLDRAIALAEAETPR